MWREFSNGDDKDLRGKGGQENNGLFPQFASKCCPRVVIPVNCHMNVKVCPVFYKTYSDIWDRARQGGRTKKTKQKTSCST